MKHTHTLLTALLLAPLAALRGRCMAAFLSLAMLHFRFAENESLVRENVPIGEEPRRMVRPAPVK